MPISRLNFTPPPSWGTRSEIGETVATLKKLETGSGHVIPQPLLEKLAAFTRVGLSVSDEIQKLTSFVAAEEVRHGQKLLTVDRAKLHQPDLFAAQKAIALIKYGRDAADVTEGFVKASGKVDGQSIAAREIFWQRWKPTGEPSGKVVVISPGFQETGRNFYEQIQALNKQGHDVIVMDHQWAGQSDGKPGGLDRGFGAARDVAAVAAHAAKVLEAEYGSHPGKEVVLFGNSMGAGPGVLGALTMNDNDLIQLDGPQMPKNLRAVLQAPFLGATPSLANWALEIGSQLLFVNKIPIWSSGLPSLTSDRQAAKSGAQDAVSEDVRAQLRTMTAAAKDLQRMKELIESGKGPKGQLAIVHGDNDPLADPNQSKSLATHLPGQVEVHIIKSPNHVLQQSPTEQGYGLAALQRLLEGKIGKGPSLIVDG